MYDVISSKEVMHLIFYVSNFVSSKSQLLMDKVKIFKIDHKLINLSTGNIQTSKSYNMLLSKIKHQHIHKQ